MASPNPAPVGAADGRELHAARIGRKRVGADSRFNPMKDL